MLLVKNKDSILYIYIIHMLTAYLRNHSALNSRPIPIDTEVRRQPA